MIQKPGGVGPGGGGGCQESGLVLLQSKESVKDRKEFRGQILKGTAFQAKEIVIYPTSH